MQSFYRFIFPCAVLAAGNVFESENIPEVITTPAGTDVHTRVLNHSYTIHKCVLHTPYGESIQFMPDDQSTDKYQLDEPSFPYHCRVIIKNIEESDNGRWELMYTGFEEHEDEKGQEVSGSQIYDITVTPRENVGDGGNQAVEETDIECSTETHPAIINTDTLTRIDYGARLGTEISITLSKKSFIEECYLTTPSGVIVKLKDVQMDRVHVYSAATEFVSCRVVIGPIEENFLGVWRLCGRHSNGLTIDERCQPGNIIWAIQNPEEDWNSRIEPRFDHPVHFGWQVTPAVRGTGIANTCHVITPAGENIALLANSDYPGLRRTVTRDVTLCIVTIFNIDANYLGNWTVYGTYRSSFNPGFNVVSQPMTFFLYDEENPHNQAYNVSAMEEETIVTNFGATFNMTVTGSGTRLSCEVLTSSGETFDLTTVANYPATEFVNERDTSVCRLRFSSITGGMLGRWMLTGKFRHSNALFTEIQQPFNIVEEDPSNPVDDPRYQVSYLNAQEVVTTFGGSVTFSTKMNSRISRESCHIRTPDNMQYLLNEETVLEGVNFVVSNSISCGVRVHVDRVANIGSWMLIARVNVRGSLEEWRLPFTIRAEEFVSAIPSVTTIVVGSDLYLRLKNPTPLQSTCSIVGPSRNEAYRDEHFIDNCGFIVRNVNHADNGVWEIVYGTTLRYRARVNVHVNDMFKLDENQLEWTKDASVNLTLGPEDAIFCRVQNPAGVSVFEGFGRCRISLDRVRTEHEGIWTLFVGAAGKVLTEEHQVIVKLTTPVAKPQVTTSVIAREPTVMISCQLPSDLEVTACKFRDPSGRVLLASQGIGEDRYSFHGAGVGLESNASEHECGMRITNPVVEEMGIWRCAFDAGADVYYGFFAVTLPWASNSWRVVTEPVLRAETSTVSAVAGDDVTMRCNVQSPIQYCYFRTRNGTIYNVSPGGSEWYEYAGAGLDAGECSIWLPSLQASDSGAWSCHVGFHDLDMQEQRANIDVQVEDVMVAKQYLLESRAHTHQVVQGQVHGHRSVEYCRFVRIDGLGFKSDNVPSSYKDYSLLTTGHCEIRIPCANTLEMHAWTVVARIVGQGVEVARNTEYNLAMPEEIEETPVEPSEELPPVRPDDNDKHFERHPSFVLTWSCVLIVSLMLFFLGMMLGPKKNRKWTHRRVESIRNSFRNSLTKKPLPDAINNNSTSLVA